MKRPGAVLDSGSVVANLQLDDPTRVVQVTCFSLNPFIASSDFAKFGPRSGPGVP